VGFEPTIPASERLKTVHAWATVTGTYLYLVVQYFHHFGFKYFDKETYEDFAVVMLAVLVHTHTHKTKDI
jgi:hypothetical protein